MHSFQNLRKKIQIPHLQRFKSSETWRLVYWWLVRFLWVYVRTYTKYIHVNVINDCSPAALMDEMPLNIHTYVIGYTRLLWLRILCTCSGLSFCAFPVCETDSSLLKNIIKLSAIHESPCSFMSHKLFLRTESKCIFFSVSLSTTEKREVIILYHTFHVITQKGETATAILQ